MELYVNFWAVLAASVASMAVGFLWYGFLFKNQWIALMGFTPESMARMKISPATAYTIQFIGYIIMAYVLYHIITLSQNFFGQPMLLTGLTTAFWVWLGFVAPVTLGTVLWEGKSWMLWLINSSHYLASLVVMGVVIALIG